MLSPEQITARRGKLTASRVAVLMNGDADGIDRLYREMLGELPEKDLSGIWAVFFGSETENANLVWYSKKRGPVSRRGEVVVDPFLEWAACTLDGWDETLPGPIECKTVAGREPFEIVIDRYQPQLQWQMFVTGAQQCALSAIIAGSEPVVEHIKRADDYVQEMLTRAEAFMQCVATRTPPVALAPVPPPVDATKVYSMEGNNRWADAAVEWIATHIFVDRAKDAEKVLKSLVPEDAVKVFGHGVRITRDRARRLSLREGD